MAPEPVATVDTTCPLYLHPAENAGTVLVSMPFDGVGYRSWRRSVLRGLSVKNKVGFVTGECAKPKDNPSLARQWERCDDMVTSWILNSLSKDIADSVEYVADSVELWKELEDRYEQANGAKLYQLQKEINDLNLGYPDDRKGKNITTNKQVFGQKFRPSGNYSRGTGRYPTRGKAANVHGMQEELSEGGDDGKFSGDGDPKITKEEYHLLISMLKQFKGNGELSGHTNISCGAVNFAGTMAPSMKRPRQIGEMREDLYYLCSRCLEKREKRTEEVNCSLIPVCTCSKDKAVEFCDKTSDNRNMVNEKVRNFLPCCIHKERPKDSVCMPSN